MLKQFLSFFAVGLFSLAAVSCLKSDDTPTTVTPSYQDPSLETSSIDSFTNAMGYRSMVYDPALTGFKYEIIERGDTVNGLISATKPYGLVQYIGKTIKGVGFDSTYRLTDSVAKMNIYGGAYYQTLIYSWSYVFAVRSIPAKIGKGGHIRFVTPSAYAYGKSGSGSIPGNMPLFFDIYLKDVTSF